MACGLGLLDNLHLYVDNVYVPLKVNFGVSTPQYTVLEPVDFQYFIGVDSVLGRKVKVEVRSTGFNLYVDPPGTPPCAGSSRWKRYLDTPICSLSNPWDAPLLPGPPTTVLPGLLFQGKIIATEECNFHLGIRVKRGDFPPTVCPVLCKEEVVTLPSTRLQAIVNDVGVQYNIPGYEFTECGANSIANAASAEAIRKLILSATSSCVDPGLVVTITPNGGSPNCVTLTIKNSPMKLTYIKAGEQYYMFSTQKC